MNWSSFASTVVLDVAQAASAASRRRARRPRGRRSCGLAPSDRPHSSPGRAERGDVVGQQALQVGGAIFPGQRRYRPMIGAVDETSTLPCGVVYLDRDRRNHGYMLKWCAVLILAGCLMAAVAALGLAAPRRAPRASTLGRRHRLHRCSFAATPVGNEQVAVEKSANGWSITSSGRVGAPFDLIVREPAGALRRRLETGRADPRRHASRTGRNDAHDRQRNDRANGNTAVRRGSCVEVRPDRRARRAASQSVRRAVRGAGRPSQNRRTGIQDLHLSARPGFLRCRGRRIDHRAHHDRRAHHRRDGARTRRSICRMSRRSTSRFGATRRDDCFA